jgi:hypothetical protein
MRGTKAGAVVAMAATVMCGGCSDSGDGTGSSALSALARFAQGEWSCEITSADMPAPGLQVSAEVEADSSTEGTFSFQIEGIGAPGNEGEWRIDGRELEMDVSDLSRYAAEGVELDTDRIEILENAPGSEIQQVGVERVGDDGVTFSWADPWSGADTQMACTKG